MERNLKRRINEDNTSVAERKKYRQKYHVMALANFSVQLYKSHRNRRSVEIVALLLQSAVACPLFRLFINQYDSPMRLPALSSTYLKLVGIGYVSNKR